jgi:TATA-box binding protein (TBP) (component of TFIID and TFIIIB)
LRIKADQSKNFHNARTISYKVPGARNNTAVKLFANGKLHITGVTSLAEALDNSQLMCRLLDIIKDKDEGTHKTVHMDLQLINSGFHVGHSLNLHKVASLLREKHAEDYYVRYDPNQHAAVDIRRKNQPAGIFLFDSGSVMLSGRITDPSQVTDAFKFLTTFLDDHFEQVNADTTQGGKRRRTAGGGRAVRQKLMKPSDVAQFNELLFDDEESI